MKPNAATVQWRSTFNRLLPEAMNNSTTSSLPFPSSLSSPSVKFSSLYVFTLSPCPEPALYHQAQEKEACCQPAVWPSERRPEWRTEKMEGWHWSSPNRRWPWKSGCGLELWSCRSGRAGYKGGVMGRDGRRRGGRRKRRAGGGAKGKCETSLSVLIFPAERETDRKSIISFFFSDMKVRQRAELQVSLLPLPPWKSSCLSSVSHRDRKSVSEGINQEKNENAGWKEQPRVYIWIFSSMTSSGSFHLHPLKWRQFMKVRSAGFYNLCSVCFPTPYFIHSVSPLGVQLNTHKHTYFLSIN